jgi:hypothetical protein
VKQKKINSVEWEDTVPMEQEETALGVGDDSASGRESAGERF